jgi:hypothetical protein
MRSTSPALRISARTFASWRCAIAFTYLRSMRADAPVCAQCRQPMMLRRIERKAFQPHRRVPVLWLRLDRQGGMARRAAPAERTPGVAPAMADTKSLRLIGYGLSAVTVLVTIVATALVVDAAWVTWKAPTVHAAVPSEGAAF